MLRESNPLNHIADLMHNRFAKHWMMFQIAGSLAEGVNGMKDETHYE